WGLGDQRFQHGRNLGCCSWVNVLAFTQCLFDRHEIQRGICAVRGNNLAVAVVEHTEFSALRIVADHGVIEYGGYTRNLHFDICLIPPEAGDAGVFFGSSHERIGGNFGVLDGVVDRFHADAFICWSTGNRVRHVGHVAGDDGVAIGGAGVGVDDNHIVDFQPEVLYKLGVDDDA